MTELETLRRRRELVMLSAELQRETVVRRYRHIADNPVRLAVGAVTSVASVPLLWKLGSTAARMALRVYRQHSPRRRRLFRNH